VWAAIPEAINCGSAYRQFCTVAGVLRLRGELKRSGFVRFRKHSTRMGDFKALLQCPQWKASQSGGWITLPGRNTTGSAL